MTAEEAIYHLQSLGDPYEGEDIAASMGAKALQKEIATKPIECHEYDEIDWITDRYYYQCPFCDHDVYKTDFRCRVCGQVLRWEK